MFADRRLLLLQSRVDARAHRSTPGTVLDVDRDSFIVACGVQAVRILRVQLEGRGPATVREFLNGHRIQTGDVLRRLPAGT
jgi:methionyl-tRNA formyltransferase